MRKYLSSRFINPVNITPILIIYFRIFLHWPDFMYGNFRLCINIKYTHTHTHRMYFY